MTAHAKFREMLLIIRDSQDLLSAKALRTWLLARLALVICSVLFVLLRTLVFVFGWTRLFFVRICRFPLLFRFVDATILTDIFFPRGFTLTERRRRTSSGKFRSSSSSSWLKSSSLSCMGYMLLLMIRMLQPIF